MTCLCGDPACPSCGPAQGFCAECSAAGLEYCICDEDPDTEHDDFMQDLVDNDDLDEYLERVRRDHE